MQKKISDMKRMVIILLVVEAALLFLFRVGLDKGIFSATIILIIEAVFLFWAMDRFDTMNDEAQRGISEVVGSAASDAFLFAETGMVMYDEAHVITWMSELFEKRGINRIGTRVLSWRHDFVQG